VYIPAYFYLILSFENIFYEIVFILRIKKYTCFAFVQWIYRMFPETFEEVLQIIGLGLRAIDAAGKNPIPIEKQFLIAI